MQKFIKALGLVAVVAFVVVAAASSASAYTFSKDLTVGSMGADVVALQDVLTAKGLFTLPAGVSKGYFGALTKASVQKYQASKGIAQTGYVGPLTRAALSAEDSSNDDNSSSDLSGGEGDFRDFDVLGNPDNEDVEEGESVSVLAFEFEAEDSDLAVEKVDVIFAETASDTKPWKVLEEVKLLVDGDEVASVDASDSSSWSEQEDDEYRIRLNDVDAVVEEGDTAKFEIEVTAQDDLDADELDTWTVELDEDGVRAIDAKGLDIYEGGDGNIDSDADEREFDLVEVDAGTLDLSFDEDDAGNEADDVDIDDQDKTEDVVLYTFKVEAQDGDVTLDEITVDLSADGSDLEDVISELILEIDGDEVGSESVDGTSTASVLFEDIDTEVSEDDEVEVVVKATIEASDDISGFAEGDSVTVEGVVVDYVDAEDDDQTDSELASTAGGEMSLRESGMTVDLTSVKATETAAPESGSGDKGTYVIKFKVTAGDEDVYVGGVDYSVTGATSGFSESDSFSGPSSKLQNSGNYKVTEGSSVDFTLTVSVTAASTTAEAVKKVALDGIDWNTTNSTSTYATYSSNLDDYETDELFLSGFGL